MNTNDYLEEMHVLPQGTHMLRSYVIGFAVSLLLTGAAFFLVMRHVFPSPLLIIATLVLALLQFLAQVIYFLHLGAEKTRDSREKLWILACTTVVVGILVVGSVWIMFTLNDRMMMSPQQMNQYMNGQSGL